MQISLSLREWFLLIQLWSCWHAILPFTIFSTVPSCLGICNWMMGTLDHSFDLSTLLLMGSHLRSWSISPTPSWGSTPDSICKSMCFGEWDLLLDNMIYLCVLSLLDLDCLFEWTLWIMIRMIVIWFCPWRLFLLSRSIVLIWFQIFEVEIILPIILLADWVDIWIRCCNFF